MAQGQTAAYKVTTKAYGEKAKSVAILLGSYAEHGENHGRKTYQKLEAVDGHPGLSVFLYFWDQRDGPELSGWWFGDAVGGTLVWARAQLQAPTVPPMGWKVPWDAAHPEPGILTVQRIVAASQGVAAPPGAMAAPTAQPAKAAAPVPGQVAQPAQSMVGPAALQGNVPGQKPSTIFINGLPPEAQEEELMSVFSLIGAVESLKIYRNPSNNTALGHGFIDFYDEAHSRQAAQELQGSMYSGKKIVLTLSAAVATKARHIQATAPTLPLTPASAPPGPAQPLVQPIPQSYLDQLVDWMKQASGASQQACKYGRSCKQVTCTDSHADGRDIEDQPLQIICRFQRKCLRNGCFYIHPKGREMDEDAELGECKLGRECQIPDCSFKHPDNRVMTSVRCRICNQLGHTRHSCPSADGGAAVPLARVRMSGFPEDWASEGTEALLSRILEELMQFGSLKSPPELSEDGLTATAEFEESASAWRAMRALRGAPMLAEKIFERRASLKEKNCSVFVGNVDPECTKAELRELAESVGIVLQVRLICDQTSGKSKGFAFCEFHDKFTAEAACQVLNGRELHGRLLHVTLARDQTAKPEDGASVRNVHGTCHAVATNLPQMWLEMNSRDIIKQLREHLEVFGKLVKQPEMVEDTDGNKQWFVEFETAEVAEQTVQTLIAEGLFDLALQAPRYGQNSRKNQGRSKNDKNCVIFVGKIRPEFTESDILEGLGELDNLKNFRLATDKETGVNRGFGFLEFWDKDSADKALSELKSRVVEVKGRKLNFKRAGEKRGENQERSRSPDDASTVFATLFVDELAMPSRPQVDAKTSSREVWADPLVDETGGHAWLGEFGEVADVFCIPDVDTGEESDRGYVRFESHEAAARCVLSGNASWSESERMLASQHSKKQGVRQDSIYSKVMARIIANISAIKQQIGAKHLSMCGEGLGGRGNQTMNISDRVHFVCKGGAETASKLQPALENMLAKIHRGVAEKMGAGPAKKAPPGAAPLAPGVQNRGLHKSTRLPPPPPAASGPPPILLPPPGHMAWAAHRRPPQAPPPGVVRPLSDYVSDAIALMHYHGIVDESFTEEAAADLLREHLGWPTPVDGAQVPPIMDRFMAAAAELKASLNGGRAVPSSARPVLPPPPPAPAASSQHRELPSRPPHPSRAPVPKPSAARGRKRPLSPDFPPPSPPEPPPGNFEEVDIERAYKIIAAFKDPKDAAPEQQPGRSAPSSFARQPCLAHHQRRVADEMDDDSEQGSEHGSLQDLLADAADVGNSEDEREPDQYRGYEEERLDEDDMDRDLERQEFVDGAASEADDNI